MQLEKTVEINAPQAKVWAALPDIQNWPLWSESTTRIERLDDGAFGMGSQVCITQPKLPVLVWQVEAFEPGASLAWLPVDGEAGDQAGGAASVAGRVGAGRGDAALHGDGSGGLQAVLQERDVG